MRRRIGAAILSVLIFLGTVLPLAGFEYISEGENVEIQQNEMLESDVGFPEAVFTAGEEQLSGGQEFTQECVSEKTVCLSDVNQSQGKENTYAISELLNISPEIAGAAMEQSQGAMSSYALLPERASTWYFDAYYVNQEDGKHISKERDFHLKYQFEFHTDTDLEIGSVILKFPRALCVNRYGQEILPADVGVPMGNPNGFTESPSSPFNYYTDGSNLIFFNYRKIFSGTNAAVQVLYKNLRILDLLDNTQWEISAEASVNINGTIEQVHARPMTGTVDSKVDLLSVSKMAYKEPHSNYTPGIYNIEQLRAYITDFPVKFQEHFSDYVYVLWKIKTMGNATQAWELYLKENPAYIYNGNSGSGEVVGMQVRILDENGRFRKKGVATLVSEGKYAGQYKISDYFSDFNEQEDIRLECYMVTAYPREIAVDNQTIFTNTADLTLHPLDGNDKDVILGDTNQWTWVDYQWVYGGDKIGIQKTSVQKEYPGWMNLYRDSMDPEEFSFHVNSECRGYGYTHHISGAEKGTYKKGAFYEVTTADDVVYAYPLTGLMAGEKILLSGEDYYFSEISIEQIDRGYDMFRDQYSEPEQMENVPEVERGMSVYAMFEGKNVWEKVDAVPWNPSGNLRYVFPREVLYRCPWRVKVVHNAVDYETNCKIDLKLCIRPDSPVFAAMLKNSDENLMVRLENLSAVTGKAFNSETPEGVFFHDQSTSGILYQEQNLIELTKDLHGVVAMRDCQMINLSPLIRHAGAGKYAKAVANPVQERIDIQYTVSAWEGYELFSEKAVSELKRSNHPLPVRKQGVFYDLLPLGVQFDPSRPIKVGRLNGVSEASLQNPALWNDVNVTVRVDSATDIVLNYRGTGRTLVKFHVAYHGEDPSFYIDKLYGTGFGISFYGVCSRKDIGIVQKVPNICAYMPEIGDLTPIIGAEQEVSYDNGNLPPVVNASEYQYFGNDINEDGITNIPNVLYCRAMALEDIATASQSGIEKTVKADEDRFGLFKKNAVVGREKSYTYNISITNIGKQFLKNMVIFDRLENAAVDRKGDEIDTNFEAVWWQGQLKGVETAMLEEVGIQPVIYYHTERKTAPLPDGKTAPREVLTEENGWIEASRWNADLSKVGAIAVDISKKSDGTEFKLGNMEMVSLRLNMQAPKDGGGAVHAYNNAAYYSVSEGATESENVSQMVIGNSISVQLEECTTFEIIKEITGEVPAHVQKEKFPFYITFLDSQGGKKPYSSREYISFIKKDGKWVESGKIHATDGNGCFYLSAGEKAVFKEKAGAFRLQVQEKTNPFWEQKKKDGLANGIRSCIFTNKYRPVLYLSKKTTGVPLGVDVTKDCFRLQITCNGKFVSEAEYWYVNQSSQYGAIPEKLGSGKTDANGVLSIHKGEIIALFPGNVGDSYKITELPDSYGEATNWLSVKDKAEGVLNAYGNIEELENMYRWKELYLTKKITHQEPEACTQDFSFQVWECADKNSQTEEKLITNGSWELLDASRNSLVPPVTGKIGADGILKGPCAGKIFCIKNLEAGKTYKIEEVNIPENYVPVNQGVAITTMPFYASEASVEITNDYQLRDLEVTKLIIPHTAAGSASGGKIVDPAKRFVMKLQMEENNVYIPKGGFSYTVKKNGIIVRSGITDSDGTFEISNSETAVFDSLGKIGQMFRVKEIPDTEYPPVYPAKDMFAEGSLGKNGAAITMINGTANSLVFQKMYVAANNDEQMEMALNNEVFLADAMLNTGISIEVDCGNGWMKPELEVLCINTVTGVTRNVSVAAGQPLVFSSIETVVIQSLKEGDKYRITELDEYRQRVILDETYTNSYILVSQKWPEKNGSVSGIYGKDLYVSITNELHSFNKGCRIYKTMFTGSKEIPKGSELVYRVEEWNGMFWSPVSGIRYVILKGKDKDSFDKIEETKEDGLIHIFQTSSGTPSVQFEKDIRPNPQKGKYKGELRITEIPELSDEIFGHLIGFSSSGLKNSSNNVPVYDLLPEDIDTFVNSNIVKEIEIEKKMSTGAKNTFAIQLIPAEASGDRFKLSSSCVDYTLFHSETGEVLEKGKTRKDGSFFLRPGQYARFYLPDGSRWTVTEVMPYPCQLERLECTGSNTIPLEENSAGIFLQEQIYGKITREMVEFGVYDPNSEKRINLTEGQITIPEKVLYNGKIVTITGIDQSAFRGCSNINSISIPEHVKSIGSYAFYGCFNLKNVDLPKQLQRIEEYTFAKCTSMSEILLPDSINEIGVGAFEGCTSLYSIRLPRKLKSINKDTFKECEKLMNIELPPSLISIKQGAFQECVSLKAIQIPGTVTEILSDAFCQCRSLDSIELPDSVMVLGANAFLNCSKLSRAVLSKRLTAIPDRCFEACTSLAGIKIPDSVRTLGMNAFKNCTYIKEVILPLNLTSIGEYGFEKCISLHKINISGNVSSLGNRVFLGCSSLEEVIFPEALTAIGYEAFGECTNLTQIQLPSGLKSLGEKSFYSTGLKEIRIPSTVDTIHATAFSLCKNLTCIWIDKEEGSILNAKWGAPDHCLVYWKGQNGPVPQKIYDVEDAMFYYTLSGGGTELTVASLKDTSLKEAIIPEAVNGRKVTGIGQAALANCKNITKVHLPISITAIGSMAFARCVNLTDVILPDQLKVIPLYAFQDCIMLKHVKLPSQLSRIDVGAFNNCTSMEEIFLPDSLSIIKGNVFKGCSALQRITIPSRITSIEMRTFEGCRNIKEVIFAGNIKRIKNGAFENCYNLSGINIPESVISIEGTAFKNCQSLRRIRLPQSIVIVPYGIFENCLSLEEIILSEKTTTIKSKAFRNCRSLRTMALPETISVIDGYVFEGCTMLDQIHLPEKLTILNTSVFRGCRNLKDLTLGNSVSAMKAAVFENCSSLKEIKIPSSVTSMERDIFTGCDSLEKIYIQKPENTLSGAPWMAPNKALIVKWNPQAALKGGRTR